MESKMSNSISVDIPNYTGPLETLLELAKAQKVDLTKISVTKLADEFTDFIKNFKDKNLDLAFEYLLMATWLTYLKSRLLLPNDEEENFKASEIAEKLRWTVIYLLSAISEFQKTPENKSLLFRSFLEFRDR